MNILFTGGSGFIGRNAVPFLRERHMVFAPTRQELNLFDAGAIKDFILRNSIDAVIHAANPNPARNTLDQSSRMIRDSLSMFLAIYQNKDIVKKVVYLGSGAIYGKTRDIHLAEETSVLDFLPEDDYGFAKAVMQRMTGGNVINLILFGCYGPTDPDSKFITHAIRCCLRGKPITIRQDCMFDYVHVQDVAKVLEWTLTHDLLYTTYNVSCDRPLLLSEIAQEVARQMGGVGIVMLEPGMNREYTGCNSRLRREYTTPFIQIEEGIAHQILWERKSASS